MIRKLITLIEELENSLKISVRRSLNCFKIFTNARIHPIYLYSIAILWPFVSMLSASIGQITAEDLLLINLSVKGFRKLREELFKHLISSLEVARCAHDNEKRKYIKFVKNFIAAEIRQNVSFSKDYSDRLWNFLGEFYHCSFSA